MPTLILAIMVETPMNKGIESRCEGVRVTMNKGIQTIYDSMTVKLHKTFFCVR